LRFANRYLAKKRRSSDKTLRKHHAPCRVIFAQEAAIQGKKRGILPIDRPKKGASRLIFLKGKPSPIQSPISIGALDDDTFERRCGPGR